MRLTARCLDLLRLLQAARWLTTSQIHRRFFHTVALDTARKRLRKLERGKYIVRYRESLMAESLFRLGPEAQLRLEKIGGREVVLERRPPKQMEHFLGINDLRIAAESLPDLQFFFACWELPALGWRGPIIPDAVMGVGKRTFAFEFDRGQEGIRFFVKTKVEAYARGCPGFPLNSILVIADRETRMGSLMRNIAPPLLPMFFSTIDLVRAEGFSAGIFRRRNGERICISELSCGSVLTRGDPEKG